MAQFQVNLEGTPVVVENRTVPLHILDLDAENPRIGLYRDSLPKSTLSDEDIRHAITNRGPDAYGKLRDSIEINQGIINPVWVGPLQHGKHLVIEGNTRVLIYRELAEKYPTNELWKSIPAYQHVQNAGLGIKDFCDWVGTQRIPRAENVRTLGDILADDKATQHFLQDGYDRAIQYLALAQQFHKVFLDRDGRKRCGAA